MVLVDALGVLPQREFHGRRGPFLAREGVPVITGPFLMDRCKPELGRLTMENTAILARAGVQVNLYNRGLNSELLTH